MKRLLRVAVIPALVATLALSACEREKPDTLATALAEGTPAGAVIPTAAGTPGTDGGFGATGAGTPTAGNPAEAGTMVPTAPSDPSTPAPAESTPAIAVVTPDAQTTTVTIPGTTEATPTLDPNVQPSGVATQPPADPTTPTENNGTTTYTVKAGDSLFSIATAFNTTVEQLRTLNPTLQGDIIFVGQTLTVPAPGAAAQPTTAPQPGQQRVHTVQQGEWLYAIARQYGVTPEAIRAANPGVNLDTLFVGQQIIIP